MFFCIYLFINLILVWHDIRQRLLPDRFTCPLLWSGLIWHCTSRVAFLPQAVIGAVAGYAGFALIYWCYRVLRGHEGLGYGDVKYLSALGAWHGWEALPELVFLASIFACSMVVFNVLRYRRMRVLKNPLPFGPFLAAAGLLIGYPTLVPS